MFNTLIRKSAIALAAGTLLLAVAPANAGGSDEPRVIMSEDGVIIDVRDTRRPVYDEDYRHEVLSQRQIVRALRHQGYPEVREIGFGHNAYRVVAIRHNGAVVRLKVSARDGRILSERRIGWVRSAPARIYERPAPRRHIEPGVSIEFGWSSH